MTSPNPQVDARATNREARDLQDELSAIRARWEGLGPWTRRADTPWGVSVVHADFGEAYVGTSLHVTPPTEKWKASAAQSARERRALMCRVAAAITAAPDDIAFLRARAPDAETSARAALREIVEAYDATLTDLMFAIERARALLTKEQQDR